MNIDLSSKVALVTGGAMGLGATIARTLAMSGVKLMLTDIDDKGGEETVERIDAAVGSPASIILT